MSNILFNISLLTAQTILFWMCLLLFLPKFSHKHNVKAEGIAFVSIETSGFHPLDSGTVFAQYQSQNATFGGWQETV